MNNFEVIIGIEIHLELNTKTKMFSSASNNFDADPNTCASVVDLAYPGTLPLLNKQAVVRAIKLGKALNMTIDETLYFDRKNYFYPDLPKGFQITQDKRPIGRNGVLEVNGREIQIERIHLEEDTAKSLHRGESTLLNYNRAGVPLIEIVTEPVIGSANDAKGFVESIKNIALALKISDAKMEEGSLRADVNISLRPYGQEKFGNKVEIKNMNSINNIQKAIDFEIKLQTSDLLKGKPILQATKRFDEATSSTVMMRVKTDAVDYKYFPETNIPPIFLGKEFIESVELEELPWERKSRYQSLGIDPKYVDNLLSDFSRANYFDLIPFEDKQTLVKIFFAEIITLSNSQNKTLIELNINVDELAIALNKLKEGTISGKHIKKIIPLLMDSEKDVETIIRENNMIVISDINTLNDFITTIINNNQSFIESNKDRPDKVAKFVLGQLMKDTKGQANPVVANKMVGEIFK